MTNQQHSVYTASPLFTPEQIKTCEAIENLLRENGIAFFAPRLDTAEFGKELGKFTKLFNEATDPTEQANALKGRLEAAKNIYRANCEAINRSTVVIANIDDRDTGTMFEIGYAVAKGIPVFTYSTHNYGCNIMISQSCVAHTTDITVLPKWIKQIFEIAKDKDIRDPEILIEAMEQFKDLIDEREQI